MAETMNEVMTTSATGGSKGDKPAKLGAIDPLALLTLAEVAGFGAEKYSAFNYLKGYDWSLSFNAMMRHALAFWNGEDLDPESGQPHAAHAAWHGLCLASFLLRDLGTDDRYRRETPKLDSLMIEMPAWETEEPAQVLPVRRQCDREEALRDLFVPNEPLDDFGKPYPEAGSA